MLTIITITIKFNQIIIISLLYVFNLKFIKAMFTSYRYSHHFVQFTFSINNLNQLDLNSYIKPNIYFLNHNFH